MENTKTTVYDLDEFVRFAIWANKTLRCHEVCMRLWPEHTKENNDWDLGVRFNYVYHRHVMMGGDCFLSLLACTPTFRDTIFAKLKEEYGKPFVDMRAIAGHLGQDGMYLITREADLVAYLLLPFHDRKSAMKVADARNQVDASLDC